MGTTSTYSCPLLHSVWDVREGTIWTLYHKSFILVIKNTDPNPEPVKLIYGLAKQKCLWCPLAKCRLLEDHYINRTVKNFSLTVLKIRFIFQHFG